MARAARRRRVHQPVQHHRLRPCPVTASPIRRTTPSGGRKSTGSPPSTTSTSSSSCATRSSSRDPIFMGSSFGGNVALQLALRRPDRFQGGDPGRGPPTTRPGSFSIGGATRMPMPPRSARAECGISWRRSRRTWTAGSHWHYYSQGSEALPGRSLLLLPSTTILRDELRNIDGRRCPVVMMTGTYDYLTPPEATENTARQIRGGVYIRNGGYRPLPDEREPRGLPDLPPGGIAHHQGTHGLTTRPAPFRSLPSMFGPASRAGSANQAWWGDFVPRRSRCRAPRVRQDHRTAPLRHDLRVVELRFSA